MDDIVDVILKADQYEYYDLKQRNIQKLKTILYTSKTPDEARLLLNISNDFTKEEDECDKVGSIHEQRYMFMLDIHE